MSSEQIYPPPLPEAKGGAKRPWSKPRLRLVNFAQRGQQGLRGSNPAS